MVLWRRITIALLVMGLLIYSAEIIHIHIVVIVYILLTADADAACDIILMTIMRLHTLFHCISEDSLSTTIPKFQQFYNCVTIKNRKLGLCQKSENRTRNRWGWDEGEIERESKLLTEGSWLHQNNQLQSKNSNLWGGSLERVNELNLFARMPSSIFSTHSPPLTFPAPPRSNIFSDPVVYVTFLLLLKPSTPSPHSHLKRSYTCISINYLPHPTQQPPFTHTTTYLSLPASWEDDKEKTVQTLEDSEIMEFRQSDRETVQL